MHAWQRPLLTTWPAARPLHPLPAVPSSCGSAWVSMHHSRRTGPRRKEMARSVLRGVVMHTFLTALFATVTGTGGTHGSDGDGSPGSVGCVSHVRRGRVHCALGLTRTNEQGWACFPHTHHFPSVHACMRSRALCREGSQRAAACMHACAAFQSCVTGTFLRGGVDSWPEICH